MTQAGDCLQGNPGAPNGNRGNGKPLEVIKPAGPMPSTIVDEAEDQESCRQLDCATKAQSQHLFFFYCKGDSDLLFQLEVDTASMCMSGAVALQEGQVGS